MSFLARRRVLSSSACDANGLGSRRYERALCDRSVDWEAAAIVACDAVVQDGIEGRRTLSVLGSSKSDRMLIDSLGEPSHYCW